MASRENLWRRGSRSVLSCSHKSGNAHVPAVLLDVNPGAVDRSFLSFLRKQFACSDLYPSKEAEMLTTSNLVVEFPHFLVIVHGTILGVKSHPTLKGICGLVCRLGGNFCTCGLNQQEVLTDPQVQSGWGRSLQKLLA